MNVNQSQSGSTSNSGRNNLWLIMTAVGFLFFLETARELIGAVYSLNLATLSLNSSVIAIFAFFSPFAYLVGLSRLNTRKLLVTSGIILAVSRVIMGVNPPLTVYVLCAVVAVIAFGIFLPALLVHHTHSLHVVCAATIGAGADLVFRALGDTFDVTVYGISAQKLAALVIVIPLAVCFVVGLLLWYTTGEQKRTVNPQSVRAFLGAGTGSMGFLFFTLLGYPNNVARWVEGSYMLAAVLCGAALGGFVLLLHTSAKKWVTSNTGVIAGSIILLAALTSCVYVFIPMITVLLCGIALFFLPIHFYTAVSYLMRPGVTVKQMGAFLSTAAVTLVIFVLLSAFSLNYAYVPGMTILRNQIGTILIAAGIITLLGILYRSSIPASTCKSILTAILGVVIIAGTWSGAAIYQTHPSPEDENLVVMTYNIQQGFNTEGKINPWEILEPIKRVNPDICALQESDTNRITSTNVDIVQWLAHKLGMYVYFGPETRQQTYGVALLSRFPLSNMETFSLTSIGEQVVLVRADIQWKGQTVSIYVTHLGETEVDRTTQTLEILEILSEDSNRKVLLGDFNSLPESEQMKAYTRVLDDAWTSAGNMLTDPLGYTSNSLEPHQRIDYILVSPEFAVKICEVIRSVYGSDHLPVWAEITLAENG